ncbi:cytochrome b N-terminal domain-containing protein [Citrobacter werkmanii]|nr:cytochrome b N-terminal domain-containing protein [Citrobacter werkmanii]MBJ9599059.1 cytochrome b N-terminal domain-containing protein [Citrobacter werkmanii]MBJ9872447.1 cytochrome b N-terminal domain-containing protein [Citrobacter werkmanii]HEB0855600.1 cytochrome b N-terminal domain-containing protein [Citrobacter freundii]
MSTSDITTSWRNFQLRLPLPRSVSGLWVFAIGLILLVMLGVQILSGIVLAMFYVPTAESAFDSIIHIMRSVRHGELVRNMHATGASLFFFACYLHIFRAMYYNVYRKPYLKMWTISVTLYVLLMITAFLGYSLIWGQKSYWAATVITSFARAIPFIGDSLYTYLVGGYAPGTSTLGRFYVLHFIIPFAIVAVTIWHVRTVQSAFAHAMKKTFSAQESQRLLFDFRVTESDAIKLTLFLMLFTWFLFFAPHYLSSADNFIPADPTVTPAIVAPEWYFLPFFSILRCFPNELAGITAMCASVLIFYFLPWLDTSRARFRNYSKLVKVSFWIWVGNAFFLGWLGSKALVGPDLVDGFNHDEGWIRAASQLSTLVYFAWFLIVLPCRRLLEKQD